MFSKLKGLLRGPQPPPQGSASSEQPPAPAPAPAKVLFPCGCALLTNVTTYFCMYKKKTSDAFKIRRDICKD